MGNPYREPRALSPERLSLNSIDSVKHKDHMVEVKATFLFHPWTPDWEGELSRAVLVLNNVIMDSSESAGAEREQKSREEYAGIVTGDDDTKNGTDST